MAIVRIQFRRDTYDNWSGSDAIPNAGEPVYETDTGKYRIGDGITPYLELPLANPTLTLSGSLDNIVATGSFNGVFEGEISQASHIQFELTGSGVGSEGKVEWDPVHKTMVMYTDEVDVAQQIGQEVWMRVYNDTLSPIENGKVVSVVGTSPDGVPLIDLSIASNKELSLNVVGISTHEIEPQTYGRVTTLGFVHYADTSHLPDGAATYLSATDAGELTDFRPASPNYEVRMGGNAKVGTVDGVLYSEPLIVGNLHGTTNFYNGTILESATVVIDSDGTDVTLTLDNYNTGENLSLIFDAEFHVMTAPKSITLLTGSDSLPKSNYVYIPSSSMELEVSLNGYPSGVQFIPIATAVVQSSTSVQLNGVYKLHKWTDDLLDVSGTGQLSFINAFIRQEHPRYKSGNTLTTLPTEGNLSPRIDIQYSTGVISQLHFNLTPGYDTTSGGASDPMFIINDSETSYKLINGLTSADFQRDSNNDLINDKYYNIVIWGTVSPKLEDCKLFINKSNGVYTTVVDAIIDNDRTSNYSIPIDYEGSGYLMTRLTLKNSGGNIEIVDGGIESLLGLVPSIGAGGGTTGGQGTIIGTIHPNQVAFSDALNSISGSTNFTYDGTTLEVNGTVSASTFTGDGSGLTGLNDRLEEDLSVTGSKNIDWSSYETFYYELTDNCTFTDINLPTVGTKPITVYMTGNFTPTWPTGWTDHINGEYVSGSINTVVAEYVKLSTTPFFKVLISQPD